MKLYNVAYSGNPYDKPAHVFFQIFRDRIVIKSPGYMVRLNSPEKIKTREVVPVRRNERIAAAMFAMGYMEERGSGFERIARTLRAYGLRDANYREEGGFFEILPVSPDPTESPGKGGLINLFLLILAISPLNTSPSQYRQVPRVHDRSWQQP